MQEIITVRVSMRSTVNMGSHSDKVQKPPSVRVTVTALIQLRDTAAADGCESSQTLLSVDHYITMQNTSI